MPKLRLHRRYATLTAALALTELLIACFVRDGLVRPYLGDTLAVILLYAAVLSVLELRRRWVACLAVCVACGLELGQALQLWAWLGLERDAVATVILGTFYDPWDLIAYAAALPLIAGLERTAGLSVADPRARYSATKPEVPLLSSSAAATTKRFDILVLLALCTLLADPSGAGARGKPRDCKPNGAPVAVGSQGAIEVAEPVQYSGENHILAADKAVKPTKLHLISPSGEAIELPSPPWTMEPSRWLSRGRAVYAVGTGRSQTQGKTDVVLVRWGSDSRPRLTKIATVDHIAAAPRAALVDEFMAVLWAEGTAGALRARASFIDIEEIKVGEPQELGAYKEGGFTELATAGKGFMAIWSSDKALMRASFDVRGKGSAPATALTWQTPSPVLSAIACGERTWLLHEGGAEKLAVSTTDGSGALTRVAEVASSDHTRTPLLCADESVVVGHRTIHEKAGNVVFWLSTIEPSGKKHERRIKDVAGTSDTIRMPLLAEAGEHRSAFWVEGGGHDARLWSRPIVCE